MEKPPSGTFVQPNGYDPLRHHPSDFFWFHVEPCFRPFQERDLSTLDDIAPTVHAEIDPPLAQRLVAALLDEGSNTTVPSSSSGHNHQRQPLWLPGSLPCLKAFNEVYESRVRTELEELGVLLPRDDAPVDDINISLTAADRIRLDAWNLRHLAASNADAIVRVHTETVSEVTTQKLRRAEKRGHDNSEVTYLKKMIESAAKKNKSRFNKLIRDMHPNHDMPTGTPIPGIANSTTLSNHNSTERDRDRDRERDRKKKKRKSNHHDRNKAASNKLDVAKCKKVRD